MPRKKTWHEKLDDAKDFPRVEAISPALAKRWGSGTVVIPTPREVDELMRSVPEGRLITINQIREIVAKRHGATIGCPIVCGIHARIAAGAAGDDELEGRSDVTPYWRTLKAGGELNEKYPGGLEGQMERLESEGHRVVAKDKHMVVVDFEGALVDPG